MSGRVLAVLWLGLLASGGSAGHHFTENEMEGIR